MSDLKMKRKAARFVNFTFLVLGCCFLGAAFGWQAGAAAFFLVPLLRVPNKALIDKLYPKEVSSAS